MRAIIPLLAAALLAGCASMTTPAPDWQLLVHGGAGVIRRDGMSEADKTAYHAGLDRALAAGSKVLAEGGLAVDAVEAAVKVLEDDPMFNAGKGAVLTRDGKAELDASIMDGRERKAGAVAQLRRTKNPISAARLVMDKTKHVMFAGADADALAEASGLEIVDPSYFITPRRQDQLKRAMAEGQTPADKRGTVGAVARDRAGNLAAATSTGGMAAKMPGRVGDVPVIGAGTYADNAGCAVSGTGYGEMYIRASAARMVCVRMTLQGMSADAAAQATLDEIKSLGGDGGLIVLGKGGDAALAMNTDGMFRGAADSTGKRTTAIFADE